MFDDPPSLNSQDEANALPADLAEVHQRLLRDGTTWRQQQPDMTQLARYVRSRVPRHVVARNTVPERRISSMDSHNADITSNNRSWPRKMVAGTMAALVVVFALMVVNMATHRGTATTPGSSGTPQPTVAAHITEVPNAHTPIVSAATGKPSASASTCEDQTSAFSYNPTAPSICVLVTLDGTSQSGDTINYQWSLDGTDISHTNHTGLPGSGAGDETITQNHQQAASFIFVTGYFGNGQVKVAYNGVLALTLTFTISPANIPPTPTSLP